MKKQINSSYDLMKHFMSNYAYQEFVEIDEVSKQKFADWVIHKLGFDK